MSKYRSKKVIVNGIKYDSKKEYLRHQELRLLEQAGAISNLQRQVKFTLIPTQYVDTFDPKTGKVKRKCVERECSYKADFVYVQDGKQIVEDTKGFRTPEYRLKRKMCLYLLGIRIKET